MNLRESKGDEDIKEMLAKINSELGDLKADTMERQTVKCKQDDDENCTLNNNDKKDNLKVKDLIDQNINEQQDKISNEKQENLDEKDLNDQNNNVQQDKVSSNLVIGEEKIPEDRKQSVNRAITSDSLVKHKLTRRMSKRSDHFVTGLKKSITQKIDQDTDKSVNSVNVQDTDPNLNSINNDNKM